jgi:hypothetical protein
MNALISRLIPLFIPFLFSPDLICVARDPAEIRVLFVLRKSQAEVAKKVWKSFQILQPTLKVLPLGRSRAELMSRASVSDLERGDAMSAQPLVPDGGVMAGNSHGIRGRFRDAGTGFAGFRFNNGAGD